MPAAGAKVGRLPALPVSQFPTGAAVKVGVIVNQRPFTDLFCALVPRRDGFLPRRVVECERSATGFAPGIPVIMRYPAEVCQLFVRQYNRRAAAEGAGFYFNRQPIVPPLW